MKVSPQEEVEIADLIADAFDTYEIGRLVRLSTGDRLFVDFGTPNAPRKVVAAEVVQRAQQIGILPILVESAARARPQRPEFSSLLTRLGGSTQAGPEKAFINLSLQRGGKEVADAPSLAHAPGFERNVRPRLPQLDAVVWNELLNAMTKRVCRIELNGAAQGTGFLVGKNLVLTNYHVVENHKISSLSCRFDYFRRSDGVVNPGTISKLDDAALVDFSPYSSGEAAGTPDSPLPTADQLDYALLRLTEDRAEEKVDGSRVRGAIPLPSSWPAIAEGDALLIMQHPNGEPVKLAMDTSAVQVLPIRSPRLRYATNTEPGSSGSPVFGMNWDLVALHHYGDPTWNNPVYNQGIPAHLIRAQLVARGHSGILA